MNDRIKGQFKKGVSGNPSGRPRGAETFGIPTSIYKLLFEDIGIIIGVVVESALDGDKDSIELCRSTIIPALKRKKISDSYIAKLMGLNTSVAQSVGGLIEAKRLHCAVSGKLKQMKKR